MGTLLAVAETGDPIRVQAWSLLAGTVLPLLVGLVTTRVTHAGVKAVLLALLSAVSGFASELLAAGGDFMLSTALFTAAATFLVAVGAHFGIWKPSGAAHRAQEVGTR